MVIHCVGLSSKWCRTNDKVQGKMYKALGMSYKRRHSALETECYMGVLFCISDFVSGVPRAARTLGMVGNLKQLIS